MQIKYSAEVDILTIRLREGSPTDSIDIAEGVIVHLSEDGKVIEIEILDASKVVDTRELLLSGLQIVKT